MGRRNRNEDDAGVAASKSTESTGSDRNSTETIVETHPQHLANVGDSERHLGRASGVESLSEAFAASLASSLADLARGEKMKSSIQSRHRNEPAKSGHAANGKEGMEFDVTPNITSTTNTTSSGDDRDSSKGSRSGNVSSNGRMDNSFDRGRQSLNQQVGHAARQRGDKVSRTTSQSRWSSSRGVSSASDNTETAKGMKSKNRSQPPSGSSSQQPRTESGSERPGNSTREVNRKAVDHYRKHGSSAKSGKRQPSEGRPAIRFTKARRSRPTSQSFGGGSSSGSGTEGGYAASASSNESMLQQSSCSSPSGSSSEDGPSKPRSMGKENRKQLDNEDSSSSSEIADFSSGNSRSVTSRSNVASSTYVASLSSSGPGSPSSSSTSTGDVSDTKAARLPPPLTLQRSMIPVWEKGSRSRSRRFDDASGMLRMDSKMMAATRRKTLHANQQSQLQDNYESAIRRSKPFHRHGSAYDSHSLNGKPPIYSLGCDLMAHCLSFFEPPEVHNLLTMPLSKDWRRNFTLPQDLWRVLCLTEPFKAKFDAEENESSDDSDAVQADVDVKHLLGKYRLLYTSFVRCMRYLTRIKEDAVNGRPPSVIDYGGAEFNTASLRANESLKSFLARARGVVVKNKRKRTSENSSSSALTSNSDNIVTSPARARKKRKKGKKMSITRKKKKDDEKVKFGYSELTMRLLGPSQTGEAGNVNLPWSCAIYSIVNWMVAFTDVEGIQTLCMKVLPFLLEDESQRTTAQRAGLTDIVLRAMVLFPDSVLLHTAAFHTIVLLARPLGGREGMLFHCSMVNSSGIFNKESKSGKNGIAVMLDSMRRFQSDEVLQAMSCWSLVNIALAPSQKAVLVKLGGISVVANAMLQHPFNAEVQFRALFALINLVIPSVNLSEGGPESQALQEQLGEVNETSEREMLDDSVGQITNLVVVAMKNFCASESILNRACLVLHNLSLTNDYHTTLLWTPNCYQMLEWCLANYRSDQVLQQSAAGTLHRLQTALSSDEDLRARFTATLNSQQQSSLDSLQQESSALRNSLDREVDVQPAEEQ